jgi:uncharacterized lipoprotein YddW (UPF0748 family)
MLHRTIVTQEKLHQPHLFWRNFQRIHWDLIPAGQTNYDLYADILLWMGKRLDDYVVPQLYWELNKKCTVKVINGEQNHLTGPVILAWILPCGSNHLRDKTQLPACMPSKSSANRRSLFQAFLSYKNPMGGMYPEGKFL